MAGFDVPDVFPVVDDSKHISGPWAAWATRIQSICSAAQQSGTTAQRPTSGLWIGRRYFDTTLTMPIYVASVRPAVWVESTGLVV